MNKNVNLETLLKASLVYFVILTILLVGIIGVITIVLQINLYDSEHEGIRNFLAVMYTLVLIISIIKHVSHE